MAKQEVSQLRDRVKAFILSKGLSVRAFEASVGLPNGSVAQYSDSTSKETLKKISEVYTDFDIDYIISGRNKDVDTNIYNDRQPILDIRVCAGNGIGLEGDENKITGFPSHHLKDAEGLWYLVIVCMININLAISYLFVGSKVGMI